MDGERLSMSDLKDPLPLEVVDMTDKQLQTIDSHIDDNSKGAFVNAGLYYHCINRISLNAFTQIMALANDICHGRSRAGSYL